MQVGTSRLWLRAVGFWVVVSAAGCGILGVDDPEVRTLEVAPQLGTCFGLFLTLCLQVREPGETEFGNLFGAIEGFEYEWGFHYVIVVEETEIANPPADGSSILRKLRKVLSKAPVEAGTPFSLTLIGGETLVAVGADRFTVAAAGRDLKCYGTPCTELGAAVADGQTVRVEMAHPASPSEPFVLQRWTICEGPFGSC